MTPFECQGGGDAAAYALGALDTDELDVFRRHLVTCSVCQEEVESLQQLTNVLATSAPQYPAPKRLRRRVMADVREDARRQQVAREFSDTRASSGWSIGGLRLGSGNGGGLGPARRPGLIGGGVAAVLVLVVVIVGLAASGSKSKSANPAGTHVYAAQVGSAQVLVSSGHGELIVHGLQQLPVDKTYEVWKLDATGAPQPTSALFNTSSTGDSAVNVPGSLQGVKKILVTPEQASGSLTPHGKVVVEASIS
jgi:anti-sigma factor RsiW